MARHSYTRDELLEIHRLRKLQISYADIVLAMRVPVTAKQLAENYLKHRRRGYFNEK